MGFISAAFGLYLGRHGIPNAEFLRVIAKEFYIVYENGKIFKPEWPYIPTKEISDTISDEEYAHMEKNPGAWKEVHITLFDDVYTTDLKGCKTNKPDKYIIHNTPLLKNNTQRDYFYELFNCMHYSFKDYSNISMGCMAVCAVMIGFGQVDSGDKIKITPEDYLNLENLRKKLVQEGRISPDIGYVLFGNCCS